MAWNVSRHNAQTSINIRISMIGQDVCDMLPTRDPHEGMSFSNEILGNNICAVFNYYYAFVM